jgi:hypothetical protein
MLDDQPCMAEMQGIWELYRSVEKLCSHDTWDPYKGP